MASNGAVAAFNNASALGPVVAIDTRNPASRNMASRIFSCTGLSSMTRTCVAGRTLCRPLSILFHHFLFRLQPVLLFQAEAFAAAALVVQLIGAQADQFVQSLERIWIGYWLRWPWYCSFVAHGRGWCGTLVAGD